MPDAKEVPIANVFINELPPNWVIAVGTTPAVGNVILFVVVKPFEEIEPKGHDIAVPAFDGIVSVPPVPYKFKLPLALPDIPRFKLFVPVANDI